MPVKKHIGQALERAIFTKPVLTFSSSWPKTFEVQPQYCGQAIEDSFSRITRMLEARYDFSQVENELKEHDRTAVQLWQTNTQKEELEYVAKSIRQRLHDGARYRIFGSC